MKTYPRYFTAGVIATGVAILALALGSTTAQAQSAGKIVCWKDAQGHTVGCGDKVPPEYANAATRELDKQGLVRKSGESTEEATKRKALDAEQAKAKAEENKHQEDARRQDTALLNTFSDAKEIDLKRDRELQALTNAIAQQNGALKGATDRYVEVKKRYDTVKTPPPVLKEEMARAEREKSRLENDIADKEKSKKDTTEKYAGYRKRFLELKGG